MKKPSLDLLIPCYNPPENWDKMIRSSVAALQISLPDTKLSLILVNDGSTQALNPTALENLKQNIHSFLFIDYPKNQGKGYALRQAAQRANSDLQILIDVDFPYTNESILKVYYSLVVEKIRPCVGLQKMLHTINIPHQLEKVISKTLRFLLKHIIRFTGSGYTMWVLKGLMKKEKNCFFKRKSIVTFLI